MRQLPKYLEFYVTNFDDIEATIKLDQAARKALPEYVLKVLEAALVESFSSWTIPNRRLSLELHKDEYGLTWWDKSWIDENRTDGDYGAYLGLYVTSYSLLDAVEAIEKPILYLYCDKKYKGLNRARLRAALVKRKSRLSAIELSTAYDDDPGYIAIKSLEDMLSVKKLRDLNAVKNQFLKEARSFTQAIAPIVFDTANSN